MRSNASRWVLAGSAGTGMPVRVPGKRTWSRVRVGWPVRSLVLMSRETCPAITSLPAASPGIPVSASENNHSPGVRPQSLAVLPANPVLYQGPPLHDPGHRTVHQLGQHHLRRPGGTPPIPPDPAGHIHARRFRRILSALFPCRDAHDEPPSGTATSAIQLPLPRCRLSQNPVRRESSPIAQPTATHPPLHAASAGRSRALAYFIVRRPRGLIAAALQYGHVSTQVTLNYSGTADTTWIEDLAVERLELVLEQADRDWALLEEGRACQRPVRAGIPSPRRPAAPVRGPGRQPGPQHRTAAGPHRLQYSPRRRDDMRLRGRDRGLPQSQDRLGPARR